MVGLQVDGGEIAAALDGLGPGPCGAVRLAYLKTEPMLDGLRSEPRSQRLLERMHLT